VFFSAFLSELALYPKVEVSTKLALHRVVVTLPTTHRWIALSGIVTVIGIRFLVIFVVRVGVSSVIGVWIISVVGIGAVAVVIETGLVPAIIGRVIVTTTSGVKAALARVGDLARRVVEGTRVSG
jgi:hypothetical protein